ncbi:MAG: 4-amino-4-deoxy-L-arabinose transferase-like glycosyltransferase, partial [Marivirga sp.]
MNSFLEKNKYPQLLIAAIAALFFIPFLGHLHLFDWDEINFAESAREMIATGNYTQVQVNFLPFWEKPPLFFWFQSLSMQLFGVNEFAARFPNAICGIFTLLALYKIGKKYVNERFGFIWSLFYFGAFLPHLYFKSGIIDPVFNLFIFLGIFYLAETIRTEKKLATKNACLAGLFTGLAILTKGPVGLLIILLTFLVYWAFNRFKRISTFKNIVLYALCTFAISFFWFGFELIKNGPWFLIEFIEYQIALFSEPVAGHKQPLYYHFVVVFLGCFPMSILAIRSLSKKLVFNENDQANFFKKWMVYLFWVVMILFTIVTTKIVHYSSMAYLPLSFLAAWNLNLLLNKNQKPSLATNITNLVIGVLVSVLLISLPLVITYKEVLIPYLKDDFAVASLGIDVHMYGWEFMIGIVYLFAVVMMFLLYQKKKLISALLLGSFSTAVVLMLFNIFVVPKIERYSQGPAIEFYESIQGED